jgi:hypothetical protein
MTTTGRTWLRYSHVTGWSSVVLAVAALGGCQTPAPPVVAPTPPKPELSYLNIAISVPLEPFEKAADEEVPRAVGVDPFKYQMNGGAAAPACGIDAGYSITRAPLGMSAAASGDAILTSIDLSYWLKGRKQIPCPGPVTVASCGTDGEPARTAKVAINTTITVLPSLATTVNSTLESVVPGNRCVLHPVELDITDTIMTGFEGSLKKLIPRLDKRVADGLNLRKRAETGWARMSEPTELRPGLWLALNPESLGVVPITVAEGELRTGLQVRLRPVVTAGKKPEALPKPFPPAEIAAPSDSFKLQIPVELQEPFVQARLDKALDIDQGGMTMTMSGYTVRVTGADIYGQGAKIAIKLTFSGDLTGTANLTGTPVYDPDTRMLSFPDLDYTLETSETLLKTASWFGHSEVRDRLRAKFNIDLGPPIDKMKEGLEAVLNGRRGKMQLHGTVQDFDVLGVYRLPNGNVFTAYLSAKGTITAEVDAQ